MSERDELIQLLDESRAIMRATIADFDIEREIYPGWTLKHFLAHIAGWDEATVLALRDWMAGHEHSVPARRGIDDYNAQSVETRQEVSYAHIHAEWELVREELKAVLREMPDDRFTGELLYPWGRRGTVATIVKVMAHHEQEHAVELAQIKAAR